MDDTLIAGGTESTGFAQLVRSDIEHGHPEPYPASDLDSTGAAQIPRSFAALRMTALRELASLILECAGVSLPILNLPPKPADTPTLIRYFHQTERRFCEHFTEPEELDFGVALVNPELSSVYDANRVLMAAIPEGSNAEEVVRACEEYFAAKGTRCWNWVMNPSLPAEQTAPLAERLLSKGHRIIEEDILHLEHAPQGPVKEASGLTIIPARASYRHARELAAESVRVHPEEAREQLIEAAMLHLDDSHYDCLLALRDGVAVAKVGVLAAGEVGRIEPLYVAESARRQGIGRTMMGRALEICARSLFKYVMLSCLANNAPAQELYRSLGFRKIGAVTTYLASVNAA